MPVARLPTGTWISLPLDVVNGKYPGKRVWLSAALHGDELNGIEVIRHAVRQVDPKTLRGAVIAAPIVNVFGFLERSRYLPDRRDLNRSFPGSAKGSMAGRLARLFLDEVVLRCDVGIDLHTGSDLRTNYPQIRGNFDEPETRRLARAFGAPVMIHSKVLPGSLRHAAGKAGIPTLLYEAGEAARFDEESIRVGVHGVLRVLDVLGMRPYDGAESFQPPREATGSVWVRAGRGGILELDAHLGDCVQEGDTLGKIYDPVGVKHTKVRARFAGMLIGKTLDPLVNRGEGIVHIARLADDPVDGVQSSA